MHPESADYPNDSVGWIGANTSNSGPPTLLYHLTSMWCGWSRSRSSRRLATTLVHILADLNDYLQANPNLPAIDDPAGSIKNDPAPAGTITLSFSTLPTRQTSSRPSTSSIDRQVAAIKEEAETG